MVKENKPKDRTQARGEFPVCNDTRACFAQVSEFNENELVYKCKILTSTYPDGKCPFCKPENPWAKKAKYWSKFDEDIDYEW